MYTTYDGTFIDYGDDDEKESITPPDSFPEPDQCDMCAAWVYDSSDHAEDCPAFEEMSLPF